MFCELFFVRESKREDFFTLLQQPIHHQVARLTPKKCSAPSGYIEENVTANQHILLEMRVCQQFTESPTGKDNFTALLFHIYLKDNSRGLFMVNSWQRWSERMSILPAGLL